MMHWSSRYVGIPFKDTDCWRLVRTVLSEQFKIDVPALEDRLPADPEGNATVISDTSEEWRKDWIETDDPQEGDIVIIRFGPYPCHIGLVVRPPLFLHTLPETNAAIENYNSTKWARRAESFWRHKSHRS